LQERLAFTKNIVKTFDLQNLPSSHTAIKCSWCKPDCCSNVFINAKAIHQTKSVL